jgi:peptide/nickel transport system substrate-binding protein
MQHKIFILMLTCLFFATSIFAQDPVVLRIGWAGSPDSLNPGIAVLSETFTITELVYDSIYQLNLDGSYSLEAAESVEVSEDGLVYTYTLREGMKFHDGEPMDSSDVVFSLNLYKNAPFVFQPSYTGYFASVEAPDERTVVLTLTDAIPNIESQLYFLYILPEHIWAEHEGDAAADFDNASLIGSGPFKLLEYSQNEFVRLGAVKDHYLNVATIDEVIFQTFANQDALVQALRTGQVDLITEMPNTAVIGLRDEENIEVVIGPPAAPTLTDIILNVIDPANCPEDGGVCSGHPALLDRNVRLAMAHATDKQQMIDVVLLGLGSLGTTLIPDGLGQWYNTDLVDYAFDITLANQILDDAGYADVDGDGIREMPDGSNPLNFRLNWPADSIDSPRVAEMLSDTWGQIGIGTQLQALDADALTAVCCPAFDYDVMIWGWGSDPDPSFLLSVMSSDEITTGTSETGYSNPTYDELYVQQQVERDLQARIDLVWQMQAIVHEDLPYIIPYYEQAVQAYRSDRFTGWITDAAKIALEDLSSLLVISPVQ